MIYDLRFLISRCAAGGVEDPGKFDRLALQLFHPDRGHQPRALGQLDPEVRFVGLFQDDRDFVDEIGARLPAQSRPVVRRNRSAAAGDLVGNDSSGRASGQGVGEFQNAAGRGPKS